MAANIITSQLLPSNVSKEIDNIYRVTLADAPSEYDKILNVKAAAAGPTWMDSEQTGIGLPTELAEGESVRYDTPVEGNYKMRKYKQYGLGYIITDLMLKDELYGKMKKLPADLARSMRILTDIEGLRHFNEAETASKTRDDKYLCDPAGHSLLNDIGIASMQGSFYLNGKMYNIPSTASALSETSFKEMQEYYKEVVDENGYPVMLEMDKLLVSIDDANIAHRLRTQQFGSSVYGGGLAGTNDDAAHMLNFANPGNGFVKGWTAQESRFLESGRWFMLSKDHDNTMYWKEQPKQTSKDDFDTDNVRYKSKMRLAVWAGEHRGTYGNIIGNDRS